MLCQNCKKRTATVNYVQEINGVSCAVHLCALCANEMFEDFGANVAEAYGAGIFGNLLREEKVCPNCGLHFSQYENTGLLGCPSCYDVFNEEIMPHIARIQGKTQHIGKSGAVNTDEHDMRLKLTALQKAMEDAMGKGDFILAGKINEQMKAIKKRGGAK